MALLAGGCAALPAHAQCQYEVVAVLHYPINCALGLSVITIGGSMNRHGTVVGAYYCPLWEHYEAFRWTAEDGFMTLQRPPGVLSAIASDINDDGVICGDMIVNPVGNRGFVYENGVWTELPPVIPESGWSHALAISNSGVVVGQRDIGPYGSPCNAYIWSPSNGFVDLGAAVGGPYSSAYGITDSGLVVGWTGDPMNDQGFLWRDGAVTLLGPVPGGSTSEPYAVSEEGVVVGAGRIPDPMPEYPYGVLRAFLWKSGSFTMLGTLPEHAMSQAKGVNGLGQVTGRSYGVNGNNNISHAVLWQNQVMTNLNDLVALGPGIVLGSAWLITDDGTIFADGAILASGGHDTLILRPVDVPVGDLDLDCRVGILDFLNMLAHWGPCPATVDCSADLNGDSVVDFMDLAMLLGNWG